MRPSVELPMPRRPSRSTRPTSRWRRSPFLKKRDQNEDHNRLARAVLDDLNSRTLGALLKIVKNIASLDAETDARLKDALKRRNYLMHHFFPTHNFAIYSAEGA
jgi:hypothetical protein